MKRGLIIVLVLAFILIFGLNFVFAFDSGDIALPGYPDTNNGCVWFSPTNGNNPTFNVPIGANSLIVSSVAHPYDSGTATYYSSDFNINVALSNGQSCSVTTLTTSPAATACSISINPVTSAQLTATVTLSMIRTDGNCRTQVDTISYRYQGNLASDQDGDTHYSIATGGDDCNDADTSVFSRIPCSYNGTSCYNWNGGTTQYNLCRATCPAVPAEICDGIDNNCNNLVDDNEACGNLTDAFWANAANFRLNNEAQVGLSSRILMKIIGIGLQNRNIDYIIYKDIPFWLDKRVTANSTLGIASWVANETGKYYFKANYNDEKGVLHEINTSDKININSSIGNQKPVAIITSPINKGIFKINSQIQFNHSSYDVDDLFSVKWDFGDGTISTANSPVHNYATNGVMNVRLTATDERGAVNTTQISILVVKEGLNLYPHITQPVYGNDYLSRDIDFNASDSYAINCSINGNGPIIIDNLKCNYIPSSQLNIKWVFNNGIVNGSWSNFSYFKKRITNLGENSVKLKLGVNNILEERETEVIYYVSGCSSDGRYYYIKGTSTSTLGDFNCMLGKCCPNGYRCDGTSSEGSCIQTNETLCQDYKSQAACESFNPATANYDAELRAGKGYCSREDKNQEINGKACTDSVSCSCYWNNTECKSKYEENRTCWNSDGTIGSQKTFGSCVYSNLIEAASDEEGCTRISWQASWTGEDNEAKSKCISGEEEICTAKLGFFSFFNLIIAVLIIIIYYIFRKNKKLTASPKG